MEETQAIGKLLETGVLGAIVVILGVVVIYLYKENSKIRDDRLTDVKEFLSKDIAFREEIKSLIQNILELIKEEKR